MFPSNDDSNTVVDPQAADVLCGRGKRAFEHAGNQQLRVKIIENVLDFSRTTDKLKKTGIVKAIIHDVLSTGGRFLKKAKGKTNVWQLATYNEARQRVSHALRDAAANKVKSMPVLVKESKLMNKSKGERQDVDTNGKVAPPITASIGDRFFTPLSLTEMKCHMAKKRKRETPQPPLMDILSSDATQHNAVEFSYSPVLVGSSTDESHLSSSCPMHESSTMETLDTISKSSDDETDGELWGSLDESLGEMAKEFVTVETTIEDVAAALIGDDDVSDWPISLEAAIFQRCLSLA